MRNQLAEGLALVVGIVGPVGRVPNPPKPPRPPGGVRPPRPPRSPNGVRPPKPANGTPGPGRRWGMARGTRGSKLALSQTHFASVAAASALAVGMRLLLTHAFAPSGVSMFGTTRLSAPRDS